jgi:hypothetical protein
MAKKKAKTLKVTLQALECTFSGGDEDDDTLEIRGFIEARGVTINPAGEFVPGFTPEKLWEEKSSDGRNIAPNSEIAINRTTQFLVFENDFLWLGGQIIEVDDFGKDDVLGNDFRKIKYSDIQNEMINVGFTDKDEDGNIQQEILARFTVEIVREGLVEVG